MVTKSAGYLHPACVAPYLEAHGGDKTELLEGVRHNSRLVPGDLHSVIADIG